MSTIDEKVEQATKFVKILSWKNVAKVTILSILAIIFITLWMFKATIFSLTTGHKSIATEVPVLYISPRIKTEVTTIVDKSSPIVAIQIVSINFQKNIRLETFAAIDNATIQALYNKYVNNKVVETPFFDNDKNNNNRILRLIGGEFVCLPYKESTAYKFAPDGARIISDVCAIGIPPIYGEFSGILTIYLQEHPSKDFQEQLHWMARDIALRIYEDNKRRNEITEKH
jgi:hypothetical protein